MKSAHASWGLNADGNVLKPDQRNFSGNTEGLQMTASSRKNSHTDLNTIYETRGNITVEGGVSLVNERNIDRLKHTHHMVTGENTPQEIPKFLSWHILTHREPTQPQHMITQMSRDTTLLILETPTIVHPMTISLQLTEKVKQSL